MTRLTTSQEPQGRPDTEDPTPVILIAPNVSERMGGEAIKSLQIYLELARRGIDVHQVTHGRVREEMTRRFPEMRVSYVDDDRLTLLLFRSVVLRWFITPYFMWRAAAIVRALLREKPGAIVHYTSPISPVSPIFSIPGATVVVGPLNGNIHFPPAFRGKERFENRFRRYCYPLAVLVHRLFFPGKRRADLILVAGGDRTATALRRAGCRPERFRASLDSGIANAMGDQPRIRHQGTNLRFIHIARLVPYKGTDLVIQALARTRLPVELDIIGVGPEKPRLEALVRALKLDDRVRFIDWLKDHSLLAETLRQYRAFVFPSLAEANGIVVQEAMMLGLPVVCVNWGGPSLLVSPECAILIEPTGEAHVVDELARAMDLLAEDGDLAERMSVAGRERAIRQGFLWADLIARWLAIYQEVRAGKRGGA